MEPPGCCERSFGCCYSKNMDFSDPKTKGEKTQHAFLCPPHGKFARMMIPFMCAGLFLGAAWGLLGELYIWKTIYSLVFLVIVGHALGRLCEMIRVPALLGMMVGGFAIQNIPGVQDAFGFDDGWSAQIRVICFVVILTRGGMSLDPKALLELNITVVRLVLTAGAVEIAIVILMTHYLLDMPMIWCIITGFVLLAVSPAIIVPSMLWCQENEYGNDKGIPTLIIAGSSIDDVFAITGFSVCLGIAFDTGESIAFLALRGPIEVLIGVCWGLLVGRFMWSIPMNNPAKPNTSVVSQRLVIILMFGMFASFFFAAHMIMFPGAGALGTLIGAFVANYGWRNQGQEAEAEAVAEAENGNENKNVREGREITRKFAKDEINPVSLILQDIWLTLAESLLFGLIGTEILVLEMDAKTVGVAFGSLILNLVARVLASSLGVIGAPGMKWTWQELLFISLAWMPKATVQAAIGAMAYDMAKGYRTEYLELHGPAPVAGTTVAPLAITEASNSILDNNSTVATIINGTAATLSGTLGTLISTNGTAVDGVWGTKWDKIQDNVYRGHQVLTFAVLEILITAPLGSILIQAAAPRLLKKEPLSEKKGEDNKSYEA